MGAFISCGSISANFAEFGPICDASFLFRTFITCENDADDENVMIATQRLASVQPLTLEPSRECKIRASVSLGTGSLATRLGMICYEGESVIMCEVPKSGALRCVTAIPPGHVCGIEVAAH